MLSLSDGDDGVWSIHPTFFKATAHFPNVASLHFLRSQVQGLKRNQAHEKCHVLQGQLLLSTLHEVLPRGWR